MKHYLFTPTKRRQQTLLLVDILILLISILITYVIRVLTNFEDPSIFDVLARINPALLVVVMLHIFSLYLLDQYNLDRLVNLFRSSIMVVLSVWLAGGLIGFIFFFFPKYIFGRKVLLIHLLVVSVFLVLWRLLSYLILIKRARPKQLAVLGNGQIVSAFIEEIPEITNYNFEVNRVCILDHSLKATPSSPESSFKVESINDLLTNNDFDVLAFDSLSGSLSNEEVRQILHLKFKGKAVYDLSHLYKIMTGRVPLNFVNGKWLLGNYGLQGSISKPYLKIKRVIDINLSFFLLILFSPLLLLIMLLIKAGGKGGIFYTQERLGIGRKPFTCYKFRTMVEGAEELSGPVWSSEDDSRITRFGQFLRKSRLDELPQLYNILKGDMSFVGPRPIREHFAVEMAKKVPFYWLRYDVKPGVTGWAQVNGRYAVPDGLGTFEYELFYIENMSIFLDLITILKTMPIILWGKGK